MPATKLPPSSHLRFVGILAVAYFLFVIALGINPVDRQAWILEHVMVVVGLLVLVFSYRAFPFSRVSYILILIFLCFHEIGTHYTYSVVPYRDWITALTGRPIIDSERNHYDRLIHFFYGLLLAWPYREAFLHAVRGNPPPFWSYLLPLTFTIATSLLYEFLEWAAVLVFGGDLGKAFLGTQGDEWDSHRDTLCAVTGALLATLIMIAIHLRTRRDYPAAWAQLHS